MRDPAAFPSALRRIRSDAGLSQSELARIAELQPAWIAHLEAGRRLPSLATLIKIADALSVSIDRLVSVT